jgi:predicted ATPase/class 3 adenylate cyclase
VTEFRVLGPVEVVGSEGTIPLRGQQQRALLAILLLHANEVVANERLVDDLYGDQPPRTATASVQNAVSQLRKQLDEGVLVTRPPGYVLRVDPEQLDLTRFERLVRDARAADPAERSRKLREALALWRGPPLADVAYEAFAQAEVQRLEEFRVATLEERIEADLQLGRHDQVIGELERLVAKHPEREHARGLLMLALYRAGRQAEALHTYQEARRKLVEELGIEPSQALQQLHGAILRQDQQLAVESSARLARPEQPPLRQPEPPAGPPAAQALLPEVRKTVTVLFSDLVESSDLGQQLDPEVFRRLQVRHFEAMRDVIARHGGIVEKYIGDAIMAVFGVPVLHEDDALRAVRAASEMREALAALNDEGEALWGVRVSARVGVNTGEVIAGDPSQGYLFVTGKAVSLAKRLEEVAKTSEILISETTHRLVRDAVLAEPVSERTAKHGEVIRAVPLFGVLALAPGRARRSDSPLVGRERQLGQLFTVYNNAIADRIGHVITVLGAAGVGKSRLVQEFISALGEGVTVLRGRCLPYGEGITYWPIAEVVREAAGTSSQLSGEESIASIAQQLAGEARAEVIAERVGAALGLGGAAGGASEETFWAFRKFFEALARRRTLVVVLDDLQWAEPTFLDLLEHVADCARDAPILFLCIARPELLDERPGWSGGKVNSTSILLEPLSDDDSRQLIANLLDRAPLPADVEARLAAAAEGNPLFAEELLAMLIDDGLLTRADDHWVASEGLSALQAPPSIHALLAARVERLPNDEQAIVTRAAVEGAVFHRSALSDLSPGLPDDELDRSLTALVRKEVIRPDRATFAGDEGFRFRHVLIRDAAYGSLPKKTRADLHERFAGWLERTAGDRLREFEEIVGYHLEQAYRYRVALGSIDADVRTVASKASRRLESAGRRALARGDLPAAIGLLERAEDVIADDDPRRAALLPELGAALIEAGRLTEAESTLVEAGRMATTLEDECAESHALVQQQFLHLQQVAEGATEEALRTVERVVPVFERCGDQRGLCRAWRLQAWLRLNTANAAAAAEAWEQAAEHARRAGDEDERSEILSWLASSISVGPVGVTAAIHRCEEIRLQVSGNLASEAATLQPLAALYAMDDRLEVARGLLATSAGIFDELGVTLNSAVSHHEAIVEMLAGDYGAAEESLRSGYGVLEQMGEKALLSTTAAFLAQAIVAQGRDDEAEGFTELSEKLAARADLLTQVVWRTARAKILARRGNLEAAERLARDAVMLAEHTDFLNIRGEALVDLAQILQEAGRLGEASTALSDGLRLYEQKGNVVAARKIRSDLAVLLQV